MFKTFTDKFLGLLTIVCLLWFAVPSGTFINSISLEYDNAAEQLVYTREISYFDPKIHWYAEYRTESGFECNASGVNVFQRIPSVVRSDVPPGTEACFAKPGQVTVLTEHTIELLPFVYLRKVRSDFVLHVY